MRGLLVVVAGFIYFLPVVVIGMLFIVPGVIAAVSGGGDAAGGLLGAGACMFWLIALVYGVAVSVLYYGALTNYAMKGTFGALFEFGAILEKVRGGTGYWNAWLFSLVIGFGMSAISSILSATGIGGILYPAVLYLGYMMVGHLFGQWSARAYGVVAAAHAATPTYAPPAPPAPPAPTYAPPAAPAATPPVPPAPPAPPAVTPDLAPPAPPAAPVAAPPAPPASPAAPIESPAASEVAEAPAPEAAPEAPAAKEADENA